MRSYVLLLIVSYHGQLNCLFNSLFRGTTKIAKAPYSWPFEFTNYLWENSSVIVGFPAQRSQKCTKRFHIWRYPEFYGTWQDRWFQNPDQWRLWYRSHLCCLRETWNSWSRPRTRTLMWGRHDPRLTPRTDPTRWYDETKLNISGNGSKPSILIRYHSIILMAKCKTVKPLV